uniref:Chromo domain-containing protein n=1 Tax=Macrostomum lignano TaxID=282301 RepID=A0A1I8FXV8_9PLAT
MYDLERGLNAYKYKWSGTDPEPQFLRKEKSSEEEATTGLPTEDSSSSCKRTRSTVDRRPEFLKDRNATDNEINE